MSVSVSVGVVSVGENEGSVQLENLQQQNVGLPIWSRSLSSFPSLVLFHPPTPFYFLSSPSGELAFWLGLTLLLFSNSLCRLKCPRSTQGRVAQVLVVQDLGCVFIAVAALDGPNI